MSKLKPSPPHHHLLVFECLDHSWVPLPISRAATEVIAWVGRRGAGKTYGCGKFVEELLYHSSVPVIIIDVVGTWWGLRVGADGSQDGGIKIPVIGGSHGDIGIVAEGGAAVAAMLVETGSSAVLDLSDLRKGARQRFVTDWAEEYFHRKKSDRSMAHVVLEEAHTLVPQRVMKGQERMLGALEDLVRLGRNYGIGVSLLDQRPQSIHKDALNQAEVLCAFQLTGAQERAAVRNWAEAKELGSEAQKAFANLSSLPPGECILWSPEWLKRCERVRIGTKATLNASATPDASASSPAKAMRPIDLAELEKAMAAAQPKSKTINGLHPSVLGRCIETEYTSAGRIVIKENSDVPAKNRFVIETGEEARLRESLRQLGITLNHRNIDLEARNRELKELKQRISSFDHVVTVKLNALISTIKDLSYQPAMAHRAARPLPYHPTGMESASVMPGPSSVRIGSFSATAPVLTGMAQKTTGTVITTVQKAEPAGDKLTDLQRKLLTALAQHGPLTKREILLHADYRPSGAVSAAFAELARKGWVVSGNYGNGGVPVQLQINGQGLAALGSWDRLPVGEAFYRSLVDGDKLSLVEKGILVVVWQAGAPITRKVVFTRIRWKPSGATSEAFARLIRFGYLKNTADGLVAADELYDSNTEWNRP